MMVEFCLFRHAVVRTKGKIPRVIVGDPGQTNYICYGLYNKDCAGTYNETVGLVNLIMGKVLTEIGSNHIGEVDK